MTEAEWLTCGDPQRMLASLRREWEKGSEYYIVSDRKLRLFACACCRMVWDRLEGIHDLIDVAERYANGLATSKERGRAFNKTDNLRSPTHYYTAAACLRAEASRGAREIVDGLIEWVGEEQMADILRDIIGNPYRLVTLNPDWLTEDVTELRKNEPAFTLSKE